MSLGSLPTQYSFDHVFLSFEIGNTAMTFSHYYLLSASLQRTSMHSSMHRGDSFVIAGGDFPPHFRNWPLSAWTASLPGTVTFLQGVFELLTCSALLETGEYFRLSFDSGGFH